MGIELGSSKTEIEKKMSNFNSINQVKYNEESIPYFEGRFSDNIYYMTPQFMIPTGDSLVASIKILYLDNLDDIKHDKELMINKSIPMNLQMSSSGRINSVSLRNQILNELSLKYGKPDLRDTLNFEGQRELINWRDRDDIDISLSYTFDPAYNSYKGNSSLILEYKYTDEMYKTVFKQKTIY